MKDTSTIFVLMLTVFLAAACSALSRQDADTAVDTLRTACEAGLVEQAAVIADAKRLEIEPAEVAENLCRIPAIYQVFSPLFERVGGGDPATKAVDTARAIGVLK